MPSPETKARWFKYAKNVFSVGVSQTLTTLFAFVVNILMANMLSAVVFGTYKFLTSWVSMLTVTSLPQVQYTYGNAVARGNSKGFSQIVWQKMKFGLIGSFVAVVMTVYYFIKDNNTLSLSFLIIAATIPFLEALTLYNGYFQGSRQYIKNARATIIQSLVTYVIIVGIFLITQSIPLLIAGYMIAWILPRIPITMKLGKSLGKADPADVQEVVQYGKRLTLYDFILYTTQFADKLVLFYLVGAREVALYTIATAFPDQIKSYVKNVYFMLQARFATTSLGKALSNTKKITLYSVIALALVTVIYIVCAPFLIGLFFPSYGDAVYISVLYSLGIISALYTIPSLAMRAHNKEKALIKINIFRGVTYCILIFAGTWYFGITGTVIGKIIGDYLYTITYYVMMSKTAKEHVA